MLILAFYGNTSLINENRFNYEYHQQHDAGAVLIEDGKIICAYEEERLNRIKHSNKLPLLSIKACLRRRNIDISQVDHFVFPMEEKNGNAAMQAFRALDEDFAFYFIRDYIVSIFSTHFNTEVDPAKIHFVNHHIAHAAGCHYLCGFDDPLIMTIDGEGDFISGGLYLGNGNEIETLKTFSLRNSLGSLYYQITLLLGFKVFDEYKVMGLAPYGNPAPYREFFENAVALKEQGDYLFSWGYIGENRRVLPARNPKEPIRQEHMDAAAAMQERLEQVIFNVLTHHRQVTGRKSLCLAGGVALNCTLVGKIAYSGLFDNIFVQPAANDGGLALGAALAVHYQLNPTAERQTMKHSYLGSECPSTETCRKSLDIWENFVSYESSDDIVTAAANLIEQGHVIGWFQGTSEFGPRALGNRSILADPRPASNKDLINEKIKLRESFRPFAPSVLKEAADAIFEMPPVTADYSYMTFILRVKPEYRPRLGAVTHVDGTARLQTVTEDQNPQYYRLIKKFGELTGIPVVLNTSFNNNYEPIVDTPLDAVNCFLTTNLDFLIIDNFIIKKKKHTTEDFLQLLPDVPAFVQLYKIQQGDGEVCEIRNTYNTEKIKISMTAFDLMKKVDGTKNFGELLTLVGAGDQQKIVDEFRSLWIRRVVNFAPVRVAEFAGSPAFA